MTQPIKTTAHKEVRDYSNQIPKGHAGKLCTTEEVSKYASMGYKPVKNKDKKSLVRVTNGGNKMHLMSIKKEH